MKHPALFLGLFFLAACEAAPTAPTSMVQGLAPSAVVGNGPARYQTSITTYHLSLIYQSYDPVFHDYVVSISNPCNGTVDMTGGTPLLSGYYTTETVTGAIAAGLLTYHSVYDGPFLTGYSYNGSFPVAGGAFNGDDINGAVFTGTVTIASTSSSNYKNHGEFVSQNPNKNDAAHSCIGMPIVP